MAQVIWTEPALDDLDAIAAYIALDKPDRKTQVGLALSPTIEPDFHAWQNSAELVLTAADNEE